MPSIVCVIVLYRKDIRQCVALGTLLAAAKVIPLDSIDLLVYDNGPVDQSACLDPAAGVRYVHDPANGKLWVAYTYALRLARERGAAWLMLLDQDTEVTSSYLAEALAMSQNMPDRVCALVPTLLVAGQPRSPHMMSQGTGRTAETAPAPIPAGFSEAPLLAWNSGAILSVAQLEAIGGFPSRFPLDNLDHVTFRALQAGAQRVFVMNATLQHNLSVGDMNAPSMSRLREKIASDLLMARRQEGFQPVRGAVHLLRTGLSLLFRLRNKRVGLLYLRFAVICLFAVRETP